jgi:hypothetical protein
MLTLNVPMRKLDLRIVVLDRRHLAKIASGGSELNASCWYRDSEKNETSDSALRDSNKNHKERSRPRTEVCLVGLKVWVDSHSILAWEAGDLGSSPSV